MITLQALPGPCLSPEMLARAEKKKRFVRVLCAGIFALLFYLVPCYAPRNYDHFEFVLPIAGLFGIGHFGGITGLVVFFIPLIFGSLALVSSSMNSLVRGLTLLVAGVAATIICSMYFFNIIFQMSGPFLSFALKETIVTSVILLLLCVTMASSRWIAYCPNHRMAEVIGLLAGVIALVMIGALGFPKEQGIMALLYSRRFWGDETILLQSGLIKTASIISIGLGLCGMILAIRVRGEWIRILSSICLAAGLIGISICGAISVGLVKYEFLCISTSTDTARRFVETTFPLNFMTSGIFLLNLFWCAMLMFSVVSPIWLGLADILIGRPIVKVCPTAIVPPLPQGGPVSTPPG